MRRSAVIIISVLSLTTGAFGTLTITPTTTLKAETGNNTSAADNFQKQSNGNMGAGNVSKVPIRNLLYAGATTPIYAHMMVWFGDAGHMDIGYLSADATQVRQQVDDMVSRGINGVIIDWYGPGNNKDLATKYFMKESELRNGRFKFAVQPDKGAIKDCANTSGCDLTKELISVLTYAYNTFENSTAYIRVGGRPIVPFFGLEDYSSRIDWAKVKSSVPGNPMFIWRNASGFSKSYSGGSFAWVGHDTNMGLSYLDNFYSTSLNYGSAFTIGSAYKGFNDTLAGWGKNQTLPTQNCGQTWLSTLKEAGKYYSSSNQLDAIHLVTWNDYEEGTEIETGIDNCVKVSGSVSGGKLSWSISGSQSTIDHFTVFISTDGNGLMPLGDYPAGQRSLDLSTFGIAPGQYYLYVKAVGQPTMANKMSTAISYKADTTTSSSTGSTSLGTAGVLISSPADGATVLSPINVIASATPSSGRSITSMKVYLDGTSVYRVDGGTLNASISAATGTHKLTLSAWDSAGTVYKSSVSVTVSSAASSTSGQVTISSPINNGTVYAPVKVTATATAPSGRTIKTMKVYRDGTAVYSVSGSSLSAYISASSGSHKFTVSVWDSAGSLYKSTVYVTVK